MNRLISILNTSKKEGFLHSENTIFVFRGDDNTPVVIQINFLQSIAMLVASVN